MCHRPRGRRGGPATAGVPVLGSDDLLSPLLRAGDPVFVAVGANAARRQLVDSVQSAGERLASSVSPAAVVSLAASIGPGSLVMPATMINALAVIGTVAVANTGAVVEHEWVVGDVAHIAPLAILAGDVRVGEAAFVGVGAHVIPGRQVGRSAVVGAGAVVTEDVLSARRSSVHTHDQ